MRVVTQHGFRRPVHIRTSRCFYVAMRVVTQHGFQQVAMEIVEFNGVNSLQEALAYENSIHRNKVAHCNEMVSVRREWWDNEVFERYLTWGDAVEDRCNFFGVKAGKNTSLKIYEYFGETDKYGGGGAGAYAKCVLQCVL